MMRAIFIVFGMFVIGTYATAGLLGWELANSGSNSRLGMPFIYGGYRGGK